MKHNQFNLVGVAISVGFQSLKSILPYISAFKIKTPNNDIILGKWHKKR